MFTATAVAISLASYHFNKDPNEVYHEINPGIFVELNHEVILGAYRNSYGRFTFLAGHRFRIASYGNLKLGGILAGCTGYDSPVCGALSLDYKALSVTFIPPIGQHAGVVAVAVKFKVD